MTLKKKKPMKKKEKKVMMTAANGDMVTRSQNQKELINYIDEE